MSRRRGCCGPCWKSNSVLPVPPERTPAPTHDTTAERSPQPQPQSRLQLYLQLIRWDRPAGWLLLLWPTLSALWVAARGFPGWHLLTVFTLGTILMRSAGCCLNDVADRDFDKHVKRTAQRPVTSGKVSVKEALMLGAVLALMAFCLVLTTNAAAIAWSFVALAVTIFYPYAKRFFAMPQAVLGVAFSFGIPMAFAAVQGGDSIMSTVLGGDSIFSSVQGGDSFSLSAVLGSVPPLAWVLLLGNLFWVLAYDTEYAMVDRDDDLKIGMKTSAITLGRFDVAAVLLCYAIYLSIWAVALVQCAYSAIFILAIGVAAMQAAWHGKLIWTRSRDGCFKAFLLNHWLGFTVFAGIALSDALK